MNPKTKLSKSKARDKFDNKKSPLIKAISAGLNSQQAAIIEHRDGPLLCIAGAGSGKTTTLTRRVANLLHGGIKPQNILLLTFTRRAAEEMLKRAQALHKGAAEVEGGTFHSTAASLLRTYGRHIGIEPSFQIIEPDDAEEIITLLLAPIKRDKRLYPRPSAILRCLSYATNTERSLTDAIREKVPAFAKRKKLFKRISKAYRTYKREHSLLDFDDLLVCFARLLEHKTVGPQLRVRWRYMMVDEHQDSNALQLRIVRGLGRDSGNIMVVGDPAQAIYGFRGSAPASLFKFSRDFPRARVMRLDSNYRSTPKILRAANAVDEAMNPRFERRLDAVRDGPAEKPHLVQVDDATEEAEVLVDRLTTSIEDGKEFSDHAVLIRSMSMGRAIEAEFLANEIPYVVRGGLRITEASHIKDLLCVARVRDNPRHEIAWMRLLKLAPRVGDATAIQALKAMSHADDYMEAVSVLAQFADDRSLSLSPIIKALRAIQPPGSLEERLSRAAAALEPLLSSIYDDWDDRKRDLEAVAALASKSSSLRKFLAAISLDGGLDKTSRDASRRRQEGGFVTISTIHSAKGLEWPVVHIPQFTVGNYPHQFAEGEAQRQEELRTLYVAITRAKDSLSFYRPLRAKGHILDESPFWTIIRPYVQVVDPDGFEAE